jgi:hypothetical protein
VQLKDPKTRFGQFPTVSFTDLKVNFSKIKNEKKKNFSKQFYLQDGSELNGNVTDKCSKSINFRPCPDEKATVYSNAETKSKFGFEMTFLSAPKQGSNTMAISSIFSSNENIRMTGKISLYSL